MALRDLNAAAMIAVAAQWLNQDRAVLESQPALRHPLELVEAAHDALLLTQKRLGSVEKAVMELTQNLTAEDAYHDRKLRGVYYVLTGNAEIADDPDVREELLAVRDTLFPLGLSSTTRSYREQAGNGKIAALRFGGGVEAWCDSIVLQGVALSEAARAWLASSQRIGDMTAQRNRISGDADDGVAAGELHQARLDWIKAVNIMLLMFDFTDFDADTRRRLLADLHDAEQKAGRARRAAKAAADKGAEEGAEGSAEGEVEGGVSEPVADAMADDVSVMDYLD